MKYLSNETLTLRALEPEDLDLLYQVENDTESWWVGAQSSPYSKFVLREYLSQVTNDIYTDKQLRLVAMKNTDQEPVALVDLFNFSPAHHRAELGLLILPQHRHKGFARQIVGLIEQFAKEHLQMHQIVLYTPCAHESTFGLFQSLGYKERHLLKDWVLLPSGYADAWLLQKIL